MTQEKIKKVLELHKELGEYNYILGLITQKNKSASGMIEDLKDLCREGYQYVDEALPRLYGRVVKTMQIEVNEHIENIEKELEEL